MTTSNPRKGYKSQPVPELIKDLWNLYFEMSLDPALATGATHIRNAALELEHTRRMAFEVAQEAPEKALYEAGGEDTHPEDEREFFTRNQKFGSVMKH